MEPSERPGRWLTAPVVGIGLGSLFSDLSHEIVTALLPALLGSFGAAAGVLGLVEGVADGMASAAKLFGGWWVDRLPRRKPLAVGGYAALALGASVIASASAWPAVLAGRAFSWLARGLRSPARKALLAEAVTPAAYGRAFGFERTMDTVGAVAAPLLAAGLLAIGWSQRGVLWLAVAPAAVAALVFALAVRETAGRRPNPKPFWPALGALPAEFRRLLAAVGVFGAGYFAPSLLTLYAIRALEPSLGRPAAVAAAVGLYAWRNFVSAAVSFPFGWLADRLNRRALLAAGYACGAAMAAGLLSRPESVPALAAVFALSGLSAGAEEVMEDAVGASLLPAESRGTGFGVMAAVNGLGDLVSSAAVGGLWTAFGPAVAFAAAAGLMAAGAVLALVL